jgi:hypothetical protein
MKCPRGLAPENDILHAATLLVLAGIILLAVYLGFSGARAVWEKRLVVSWDKKHALEGRAAIIGGIVLMLVAIASFIVHSILTACSLGRW